MKKRIALIINGGVGAGDFLQGVPILVEFIERIAKKYAVTVYVLGRTDKNYQAKNFRLRSIPTSYSAAMFIQFILIGGIFFLDHLHKKYDMIHSFWALPAGWIGVVLGKIFRIPVVVSLQGGEAAALPEENYGGMLYKKTKKRTFCVCRQAKVLTALSRFQVNELSKHGFQRKDLKIIPYGVDMELFKKVEKTLSPPYHFIHVANLNKVKDQVTLLKAFALISREVEADLQIIGTGHLKEFLEQKIIELNIADKVSLSGAILHRQLPQYYQKAHFLLHTSLYEGQCLALVEAMASGVFVCSTEVGLAADLKDSCCLTVAVQDYKKLAQKVIQVIHSPEIYRQISENAYQWVRQNDINYTVRKFQEIYENLWESI